MRKYVHKLFAAFLSVCLLISYNPTLGMAAPTDTGEVIDPNYVPTYAAGSNDPLDNLSSEHDYTDEIADLDNALTAGGTDTIEGNGVSSKGEISSSVNIGTFTNGIETASSSVMFASVDEITETSIFSYVGVAATGGHKDDYHFSWAIYKDGEYVETVEQGGPLGYVLTKGPRSDDPNVIISKFQLYIYKSLKTGLEDGHLYTFKCTLTDGESTVEAKPIYLYTIPNKAEYDDYYLDRTAHNNDDGFAATPEVGSTDDADFSINHDDVAVHADLMYKDAIVQASERAGANMLYTEMLAYAGMQGATGGDKDYKLNKIWQVSMESNPASFDGTDVPIEPYLGDSVTMYLPFDDSSQGNTGLTAASYVAQYGETIQVLWSNGETDESGNLIIETLDGTIHVPEDGSTPYVELPIEPGSKYALGNFGIRYIDDHSSAHRFELHTQVTTNNIEADNTTVGGWFVPKGLVSGRGPATTFPNSVNFFPGGSTISYGIQLGEGQKDANGNVKTFYQLDHLTLTVNGAESQPFVKDGEIQPGVNNDFYSYDGSAGVSATGQTVTIKPGTAGSTYIWKATFKEVDVNDAKGRVKFDAEVISEKDFYGDKKDNALEEKLGTLRLLYNDPTTGDLASMPALGDDATTKIDEMDIRNNAQAKLWLLPDTSQYDVTGIRVSNGDRYQNTHEFNEDGTKDGLYTTDPDLVGKLFYTEVTVTQPGSYNLPLIMKPEFHVQICFGKRTDMSSNKHTVTVTSNDAAKGGVWENGAFAANPTPIEFNWGVPQEIALKAQPGYKLGKLTLEVMGMSQNVAVPVENAEGLYIYSLPNINMDYDLKAEFVEDNDQYTMTVETYVGSTQSDAGGVVTPGSRTVRAGETCDFQIIPNRGYQVASVALVDQSGNQFMKTGSDGVTQTPAYSVADMTNAAKNGGALRLVAPGENSRLLVTFESNGLSQDELDRKDTVSVQTSVKNGVGGTVTPNGSTNVRIHDSFTMSFNPASGYEVANILVAPVVNGVPQAATTYPVTGRTYVISNVDKNLNIEVEYREVTADKPGLTPAPDYVNVGININNVGSGSGVVSPTIAAGGKITVPKGSSVPFSFTPNPGSTFKGATITFEPSDATGTRQELYIGPNDAPYGIISGLSNGTITVKVTFDGDGDNTGDTTRFALTTQATGEGRITPPSGTTMVGGADQWVNFMPNKATTGNGYTLGDGAVTFDDTKLHAFYSPASATIRFAVIGGNGDNAGVGEAAYASGTAFKNCGPVGGSGSGLLDGIINQGNYSIKLQSVRSDITVTGAFVAATSPDHNGPNESKMHRVDACVASGIGTVSPGGTMRVQEGSSQTFVFKPIAGYKIKDIEISTGNFAVDMWNNLTSIFNGGNAAKKQAAIENGFYTIENIRADYAVKVYFALDTGTSTDPGANLHPVTVLTDGNGTVSPSGVVLLKRPAAGEEMGETQTFIAKPNPGYTLKSVDSGDGSDTVQVTTHGNSLEFEVTVRNGNSTASVIRVTFAPGTAPTPPAIDGTVNIESSPHGVVAPVGAVSIPQGGSQTINAIPQPGYEIDQILVTDDTGTHPLSPMIDVAGGSFVVGQGGILGGKIPSNIKVTFKEREFDQSYYTINAKVSGGNGKVTPGTCTVPADQSQTLFIQPERGYKIASITDNAGANYGASSTTGKIKNSWIINPVKDSSGFVMNREITVTFTPVVAPENPDDFIAETVKVYNYKSGTGRANGVVSPGESFFEIEKGSNMLMTFYTTDSNTNIYGVKVNGKEVMGLSEDRPLDGNKGSFRLTSQYTRSNLDFGVFFGKDGQAENPNKGSLSVQVGGGGTGSVTVQGSTVSNGGNKTRSNASTGSGAAYGDGNSREVIDLPNVDEPMDLQIIPENGSHVAKVLMTSNCEVINYTPDDYKPNGDISQTLTYRIFVTDSSSARVYVEFSPLNKEAYFDPSDPAEGTYVDDDHSYNADVGVNMSMDVQGNIADLVGQSGKATDLLDLRLPSNARQAGNNGQTITYTIPQSADSLTFEVGPLIKLGSTVADSTLYTLDRVEVDGVEVPKDKINGMISADLAGVSSATAQAMAQGATVASFDDKGNLTEKPLTADAVEGALSRAGENGTYYQYYTFETDNLEPAGSDPRTVTVHLRKLSTEEAENGNYFIRNNEGDTYNITTRVSSGPESGTLSIWPAGPAIQRGQTVTVNWKPAEGYGLKMLTVGGVDVTSAALAAGSGNFPVVADANKEIVAEFVSEDELVYYDITVTSQGHGTVKAPGLNVTSGQTQTAKVQRFTSAVFSLVPEAGYRPAYVTLDGHRTEWTAYTYPLAGVTDDHTLVFEFAKDDGSGSNGNGNNNQTGIGGAVNSALSQTGDNPWLVGGALLVLIAVVCALVARRMRQASTAAATEAAQRRAYREYMDYHRRR